MTTNLLATSPTATGGYRPLIWAAVSTQEQASADRYSIDNQLAACRAWLERRGLIEAEPPAVVAGHSREYLSLDAAMAAMPELRRVIELARAGTINLVVVWDLNRWRSLQAMVVKLLSVYSCQVYAINQPVEPQAPASFGAYTSDTAQIISIISSLTSSLDIASLRRKHAQAMPDRVVRRGLHPGRVPYGYRVPSRDPGAVAVLVPDEAAVVRWLRDEYLRGESATELARRLIARHVPTREGGRWCKAHVLGILTNPWYAGLVAYQRTRRRRDPMSGQARAVYLPRADWLLGQGRHEPLWTEADYQTLLRVREERGQRQSGKTKVTHAFSRLLTCAHCGSRLWHRVDRHGAGQWECSTNAERGQHALIEDELIEAQFAAALGEILAAVPEVEDAAAATNSDEAGRERQLLDLERAAASNEAARARYQRAFGQGLIDDADLAARMQELGAERDRIARDLAAMQDQTARAAALASWRASAAELIAGWRDLMAQDPLEANAVIAGLVERIVVGRRWIDEIVIRAD